MNLARLVVILSGLLGFSECTMEIQQLVITLQHCMSPNPEERNAAEQALNQVKIPRVMAVDQEDLSNGVLDWLHGLVRLMLHRGQCGRISETGGRHQLQKCSQEGLGARLGGCVDVLVAIIEAHFTYKNKRQPSKFCEEDKATVRSNLLEAIIRAPPKIKSQLGEVLKYLKSAPWSHICAHLLPLQSIVYSDYPEQWPDLLPAVMQNIGSQEQLRLHGALFALRILARKYEFKDEFVFYLDAMLSNGWPKASLMTVFLCLAERTGPSGQCYQQRLPYSASNISGAQLNMAQLLLALLSCSLLWGAWAHPVRIGHDVGHPGRQQSAHCGDGRDGQADLQDILVLHVHVHSPMPNPAGSVCRLDDMLLHIHQHASPNGGNARGCGFAGLLALVEGQKMGVAYN
eukprot:scaffold404857_cov51-Prasinocladus_malaysianus.AAC.3